MLWEYFSEPILCILPARSPQMCVLRISRMAAEVVETKIAWNWCVSLRSSLLLSKQSRPGCYLPAHSLSFFPDRTSLAQTLSGNQWGDVQAFAPFPRDRRETASTGASELNRGWRLRARAMQGQACWYSSSVFVWLMFVLLQGAPSPFCSSGHGAEVCTPWSATSRPGSSLGAAGGTTSCPKCGFKVGTWKPSEHRCSMLERSWSASVTSVSFQFFLQHS